MTRYAYIIPTYSEVILSVPGGTLPPPSVLPVLVLPVYQYGSSVYYVPGRLMFALFSLFSSVIFVIFYLIKPYTWKYKV